MPEITKTASEVAAMLENGAEITFLDVGEIVPFGIGHPLLATHLALGHIEFQIARLVPRLDTRIIVTDGGESRSVVAAHRLAGLDRAPSASMTPQALDTLRRDAAPMIIDVGHSEAYVRAHVPGAR